MKSTSLRRAAFAALALAPVLTACGFNAQTDQVYQPAEGVINRDGDVDVLNALIVSDEDGAGTLVASLVNNDLTTPDRLTGVTGPEITVQAGVFARPKADVVVAADGALNLATKGEIIVRGAGVTAGSFVELTLAFSSGQSTTIKVPVVRRDGYFADVPVPGSQSSPTADPTGVEPSSPTEEVPGENGPSAEPTGSAG